MEVKCNVSKFFNYKIYQISYTTLQLMCCSQSRVFFFILYYITLSKNRKRVFFCNYLKLPSRQLGWQFPKLAAWSSNYLGIRTSSWYVWGILSKVWIFLSVLCFGMGDVLARILVLVPHENFLSFQLLKYS